MRVVEAGLRLHRIIRAIGLGRGQSHVITARA